MLPSTDTDRSHRPSRLYGAVRRPVGATAVEYLIILVAAVCVLVGAIHLLSSGSERQMHQSTQTVGSMVDEQRSGEKLGQVEHAEYVDRQDEGTDADREDDAEEEAVVTSGQQPDSQDILVGGTQEESGCSGVDFLVLLVIVFSIAVLIYTFFFDDESNSWTNPFEDLLDFGS